MTNSSEIGFDAAEFAAADFAAAGFAANLVSWYRRHARPLPWRESNDPYAIWVSEVMLQQTRVETVIPYYRRFLALFPTIDALAAAPEEKVLKAWEGLGYYRRARLLQRGAQEVQARFGGRLPAEPQLLRSLPGVGAYMAGSLASIAFNLPVPAVDGNVSRVAARVLAWEKDTGTAESRRMIEHWAQKLYAGHQAGELTQALMELGALICLPANPDCPQCPVRLYCLAAQVPGGNGPERFPLRKKSRENPVEYRIALQITRNGRQLYLQRKAGGLMAGFWEYPSLVMQSGADPQRLAGDWCQQQLGARLAVRFLRSATHVFTHLTWNLDIYEAAWQLAEPPYPLGNGKWFSREEADKLPRVAYVREMESE